MDKITDPATAKAAKITSVQSDSKISLEFKANDAVTFYDKHNKKLRGTVRWISANKSNETPGPIIGIEAVRLIMSMAMCTDWLE